MLRSKAFTWKILKARLKLKRRACLRKFGASWRKRKSCFQKLIYAAKRLKHKKVSIRYSSLLEIEKPCYSKRRMKERGKNSNSKLSYVLEKLFWSLTDNKWAVGFLNFVEISILKTRLYHALFRQYWCLWIRLREIYIFLVLHEFELVHKILFLNKYVCTFAHYQKIDSFSKMECSQKILAIWKTLFNKMPCTGASILSCIFNSVYVIFFMHF